MNDDWINTHFKVIPFDYLAHSQNAPQTHTPDANERELVSLRKQKNYIYEG